MGSENSREREIGRFAVLLAVLIGFLCVMPFTAEEGVGWVILRVGSSLLLLASVYAASDRRFHLMIAISLAVPALTAQTEADWLGDRPALLMRMGLNAALLFYVAGLILNALLRQRRISADTIFGGINVYLLLAIGFAYLHGLVELFEPGSYQEHGENLSAWFGQGHWIEELGTLFYFSTVTMTTLGYGDMAPVSAPARMLCSAEAVAGQLYVAIFIARLVALHASRGDRAP